MKDIRQSNQENDETSPDQRNRSIDDLLGPRDGRVLHASTPLSLGGNSDVYIFRRYVHGVTYVTADLLSDAGEDQIPSAFGRYALMICTKEETNWAAQLIARLARYTLEAQLNPGDTMDLGPFKTANLKAILFTQPNPDLQFFDDVGHECRMLLCIGVTEMELRACKTQGSSIVLKRLEEEQIFPFTDPGRLSVF